MSGGESLILASAVATVMAAMTVIGWTSAGRRRHAASRIPQSVAVAAATLAVGLTGRFTVPVLLIATLAGLCVLQLVPLAAHPDIRPGVHVVVIISGLKHNAALAETEKKFAISGSRHS